MATRKRTTGLAAVLVCALLPCLAGTLSAATRTWSSTTFSTSWTTGTNWVGGIPPAGTDDIVIQHNNNGVYPAVPNPTTMRSLTINANASLDLNGSNVTINGALTILGTGFAWAHVEGTGVLSLLGTETVNGAGFVFDVSRGTVRYHPAAPLGAASLGLTYYNLELDNDLTTTWSLAGNLTVNGTLCLHDGTLSTGTRTLTAAALQIDGGQGGFGGILQGGSAAITVNGTTMLLNDWRKDGVPGPGSALPAKPALTGGSGALSLNGDVTGAGAFTASSSTTTITGNLFLYDASIVADVTTAGATGSFAANGGTVVFNGGGSPTEYVAGGAFNKLTVSGGTNLQVVTNGAGGANALNVNATGAATLTTSASTDSVTIGSQNFTITTLSNQGTVQLDGTQATQSITTMDTTHGTVTYVVGAAAGIIRLSSFFNLGLSGTGQTFALGGAIVVNGNLAFGAGSALSTGATGIQIAGNWDNSAGGTFTPGAGTVTFITTAASQVLGATTFNGLACTTAGKTIQFAAGLTQTVGGTLTMTGALGNYLRLQSTTAGSPWTFAISAAKAVSLVAVQDAQVTSANFDITAANSINVSGNETTGTTGKWVFVAPGTFTWTGNTVGTSTWTDTNNWSNPSGAGVPGYGDSVSIPVVVGGRVYPQVPAGGVTISALAINGGQLIAGAQSLTVASNTTFSGGLTVSSGVLNASGGANVAVTGPVSFAAAGYSKGAGTFTFNGGVNQNLTSGTNNLGAMVVQTGGTNVVLQDALTVDSLTISAGTLSTNGDGLSVGGNLTGAGSLTASGSEAISVGGNWNVAAFTPATSTVTFTGGSGAGPFTVTSNSQSFSSVTLNANTKVYQQAAGATGVGNITGVLTLSAGTWSTNGDGLSVGSDLTGAGSLTASGSEVITVGGSFTPALFTAASSTVVMNGTSSPVSLGGLSYNNLTLNKGAAGAQVSSTGGVTVGGVLSMTAGTWVAGGSTYTHTIAGGWNSSGGSFTFTAGSSTVVLSSATPVITTKGIGTDPFNNLTVNNGGSMASAVQAVGNLQIVAGALGLNGHNLSVGGNLTGSGLTASGSEVISVGGNWNVAAFTPATSTVTFTGGSGAGPFTVTSNSQSFSSVTLNANTKVYQQAAGATGVGNITGVLTLSAGTWSTNGDGLSVGSDLTGAGSLTASGSEVITVGGSFTPALFTAASSTVVMNGTSSPVSLGGLSYNNLTLNKGAAGAQVSSTGGVTVGGVLSMTAGTWVAGGSTYTHTIAGGWNSSGGSFTFTAGSSTVVLSSATPVITTKGIGTDPFNNLTVNNGGSMASAVQAVGNLQIVAGALGLNGHNLSVGSDLTGAGSLTASGSEVISVGGNWNVAAFTPATSTVTFTGGSGAGPFTVTSNSQSFSSVTLNANTKVYQQAAGATGVGNITGVLTLSAGTWSTNGDGLSVGSDLTGAGSLTASGSEAISVGGNWNVAAFTPATSTVTFTGGSGAGPFTVTSNSQSFSSVTLNANTKVYQQAAGATGVGNITGVLTLSAGTWSTNGDGLSVGGNLTGAGSLMASGSEAISVGGNWNVAAFTPATSTVTFTGGSGAGPFTVTSNSQSFSSVTLNANTKVYQQAAGATGVGNITGVLTLSAGTWSTNGDGLSVGSDLTGAGSLTASGSEVITVGGSFTPALFTAASSTVVMNGTSSPVSLGGLSYNNLTLNKGAAGAQVSSTGGVTVGGVLSMTAGTWVAGGSTYTHTIAGGWNSSGGSFTFTAGSSTVVLSSATPVITTKGIGTDPFNNLTVNNGGSMASAVQAVGNLQIVAGTLGLNGHNLSVGSDLTGAGSLTASGSEVITVGGSFTPALFTAASSTVVMNGTSSPVSLGGLSYNNLTLNKGAAGAQVSSTGGVTVGGVLSMTAGTWVAGGSTYTHTIAGGWNSSGGSFTFTAGSSTVVLSSATPVITTKGIGTDPFNNLTVNNGGSMASAVQAVGNLQIVAGALGLNGHNLSVGSDLTGAGSLTASGSEVITVGGSFTPALFTAASSTVVMNGTSSPVSLGGLSYNNLTLNKGAAGAQVSSTGGVTVGGVLSMTAGTWVAGGSTYTHTIAGGWNSSGGSFTFTAGSSTVVLSSATPVITTKGIGTDPFNNLTVNNGGSMASAVQAVGNLQIVAGALGLNGHNLSVGGNLTGSGLTASGSEAISVGGNWNVAAFTPATSTVTFTGGSGAGPFTVTSNSQSFSSVTLNANTKVYQQAAGATGVGNITGVLTLSAGTWSTNGDGLSVGSNLTGAGSLTASGSEVITVGGSFTPALFTAASSTVVMNGTSSPVSLGGLSYNNLTLNKGAAGAQVSSTGGVTVGGVLSMTAGTWVAGGSTYTHTIAGGWNSSGGSFTFTAGSSTVVLSSATPVITTKGIGTDPFNNLTVNNGGSMASAVQAVGNLQIVAGALGLNGHNLSVGGNLTGSGLTASGSEAISVGGNWNVAAFAFVTTRVSFTGNGALQAAAAGTFYDLVKTGAGTTTTFNLDLTIINSLTLTSGTLADGGAFTITMGNQPASPPVVTWDSSAGGSFSPGNGSVHFDNPGSLIKGANTFYQFYVDTSGLTHPVTISFAQGLTQTVTNDFHVLGTGARAVILLSASGLFTPPPPDDPALGLPLAPPASPPPHWSQQWYVNLTGTATIDYAIVQLSWASSSSITPGPNCTDNGYNDNWFFVIPIIASWTVDSNNNGRIDRIRVQVKQGTQLNNNPAGFAGFTAQVSGYRVTGYADAGAPGRDVFDILVQEGPPGPAEDTDARPAWQVLSNTTLKGTVGGALVEHNVGTSFVKVYTAADGARPVINYTLAALNTTQAYVHFSELVYGSSIGGPIGNTSLTYSGGLLTVQPVEMTGSGARAAIVTFAAPLTKNDILAGAQTISAAPGGIWGGAANPDPASMAPPATNYTNVDGNLPPNATRSALTAPAHNISDVALGFATPVFAVNRNLRRDPARGGIGMVTSFDGTRWLLPQDVLLEARITEPTLSGAGLTLFWDVDPPASVDLNNLWIPPGASTLSSGSPGAGDRAHFPGDTPQARSVAGTPNGALRDFIIPGSDPAIRNGAVLQFMFILDDGAGHTLPVAFQADPQNPGSVRPFEYSYHSIVAQRGGVTISNNVINPAAGQSAYVHYTLETTAQVTITVFNLAGDIINVLTRAKQGPGEYTTAWDGKNRSGRPVARGIYFVRVVGPGFDEMRKVLVVR